MNHEKDSSLDGTLKDKVEGEGDKKFVEVEAYLIRHGQQDHKAKVEKKSDKPLTPEGREQSRNFARKLVEDNKGKGPIVIKINHSPVVRADQTAEEIEHELRRIVEEEQISNIKILTTRSKDELNTSNIAGPMFKRGIPVEQMVDYWLEHGDEPEFTEFIDEKDPSKKVPTPQEITKQIRDWVMRFDRLAKKIQQGADSGALDPKSKYIYVWVTHDPSHGAILQDVTGGKLLADLGGNIEHTEAIKIKTGGNPDKEPMLDFRGKEYKLNNES